MHFEEGHFQNLNEQPSTPSRQPNLKTCITPLQVVSAPSICHKQSQYFPRHRCALVQKSHVQQIQSLLFPHDICISNTSEHFQIPKISRRSCFSDTMDCNAVGGNQQNACDVVTSALIFWWICSLLYKKFPGFFLSNHFQGHFSRKFQTITSKLKDN